MSDPHDLLTFWFAGVQHDPTAAKARKAFWFHADQATDEEIKTRFSGLLVAAQSGALNHWEAEPRSALALVIALDQLPRNIHRRTPAAFACDGQALGVTRRAVEQGYLQPLTTVERIFLLMPYEHVEDAASQREGLVLFEKMANDAPPEWRAFAGETLGAARDHAGVVERFGRFPHRNAILGRTSTPAEREFLESKPKSWGQGS